MFRSLAVAILCFIGFNVNAQEIWLHVGYGINFDTGENSPQIQHYSFPITVMYAKIFNPTSGLVIAAMFNQTNTARQLFENGATLDQDGWEWKNTNLEIPIMYRLNINGTKAASIMTGISTGFTLSSLYSEDFGLSGNLQEYKVKTRTPYFSVPLWIDFNINRFSIATRFNFRLSNYTPKEYPAGSSLESQYYDNTGFVNFNLSLGYRLI